MLVRPVLSAYESLAWLPTVIMDVLTFIIEDKYFVRLSLSSELKRRCKRAQIFNLDDINKKEVVGIA